MECESVAMAPVVVEMVDQPSAKRRRASSVSSRKRFQTHGRTMSSISGKGSLSAQQITPPPTPNASQENLALDLTSEQQMSFLRAFFPFESPSSSDPSTVTLQLVAGDILLVHSIHGNGWADGTKLSTGNRGWLPTNYCEEYDPDQMRTLLKSCLGLFEKFRVGGAEIMSDASMVSGVVAGVKCLLEATNCLTRDALIVQTNNKIRRTRKVLLSELSLLVKAAKLVPKQLAAAELDSDAELELENAIDEVILRAFKIVVRGVKFLDIWQDDQDHSAVAAYQLLNSPPTPPVDTRHAFYSSQSTDTASEVCPSEAGTTVSSQTSYSEGRSLTHRSRSYSSLHSAYESAEPKFSANIDLTFVIKPGTKTTIALTISYDRLLFLLGSLFERLNGHPQFKSVVQEYTNSVISDGLDFVTVVDAIVRRDSSNNAELVASKDAMFQHLTDLANLGTEILSIEQYTNRNTKTKILTYDETEQLKVSATSCVRGCCDTYRRAEAVLQTIPDFAWDDEPSAVEEDTIVVESVEDVESPVVEKIEQLKLEIDSDTLLMPPPGFIVHGSFPPTPTSMEYPADITMKDLPPTPGSEDDSKALPDLPLEAQMDKMMKDALLTPKSLRPLSISSDSLFSCVRETDASKTPTAESASRPSMESAKTRSSSFSAESPYQNELVLDKHGSVCGGTLPALVERLTLHNAPAEAVFTQAFYLTFRIFTTPQEFAQTLVERFEAVSEDTNEGQVVRLRVFNVFKSWLESYWRHDLDFEALNTIRMFGNKRLSQFHPRHGQHLKELIDKVTSSKVPLVPRLASALGSMGSAPSDLAPPAPGLSRTIRQSFIGNSNPSKMNILDIDASELARQLTLKTHKTYCAITPDELLEQEWHKKDGISKSHNVKGMMRRATELTYLAADTILMEDEPKKRALTIKHWIKVAQTCNAHADYETLMAIMCTLNCVAVIRLKKSWEFVPPKWKAILEQLRGLVDPGKNSTTLRGRLREQTPPCIPFIGMFLTDLVMTNELDKSKRPLSVDSETTRPVINFEKHLRTAKIIHEIQRFQVPYEFPEKEDVVAWLDMQIDRIRKIGCEDIQPLYKRSCVLEPKIPQNRPNLPPIKTTNSNNSIPSLASTTSRLFGRG